jgi:thiol-disulfide isomerase/thioredoxin
LTLGLAAGLAFDAMELRGVTVETGAEPAAQAEPAPVTQPMTFDEAFAAGIEHFRKGDAHSAARAFEAARSANPHAPNVYVNLGFAYLEMGQLAASRTVFEKASSIAPGQANAYYGLAEVLEALGDIQGAIGAMRTFVHLAPDNDPFRRRAMSALWEWETGTQATRTETDEIGPPAPAETAPSGPTGVAVLDAPLLTLDGAPTNLATYRGKVLILNVWATWCGPCRAELPSLDRLNAELDPALFAVAGVSIDKERAFTREYITNLGIEFPNYWDGDKHLTEKVFSTRAVPLTLIIDRQGEIVLGYEGARDWSEPALVEALRDLVGADTPFAERVAKLQEELK